MATGFTVILVEGHMRQHMGKNSKKIETTIDYHIVGS